MKTNWKTILKIVITVLTALAGALGVASCTRRATSAPTVISTLHTPMLYETTITPMHS